MFNLLQYNTNARTVDGQLLVTRVKRSIWWLIILLVTAQVGRKLFASEFVVYNADGVHYDYATLGWLLYTLGVLAIIYRPRFGIYLTTALALAGDPIVAYWYPFDLNFSSEESILFLNDSLVVSPLETYIIFTALAWILRLLLQRKWRAHNEVRFGMLFLPAVAFGLFVIFGLAYGISNGGDPKIALWEARPLFYLPALLLLTTNLIQERGHVRVLMWSIVVALFFEGIMGTRYFIVDMGAQFIKDSTIDHAAAIQINFIFIFLLAIFVYRVSWGKRFWLLLLLPPIALTYITAQRRSAFLTLAIAMALLSIPLFRVRRRLFLVLAPLAVVVGLAYTALFWNSSSMVALPAQAVKSVLAQDAAGSTDRHSNVYREIENINIHFTIQNRPLTGIGFGQKFYLIVPMADISFFEWWEYITHNSILWIWMKMGAGGFLTMMVMVGMALMRGGRAVWRMPNCEEAAITVSLALYLVMHFLFAYVDMSWGAQSMVLVGVAMGILNSIEAIMERPQRPQRKRWHWKSRPAAPPQLRSD